LAGMPRAFVVLTVENVFNVKEKKWYPTLTNHRVFMGPQDKVDKCKELVADFNNPAWKVELQERAL